MAKSKLASASWGPYTVAVTILEAGVEVDFITCANTTQLREAIKVLEAFILTEERARAVAAREPRDE